MTTIPLNAILAATGFSAPGRPATDRAARLAHEAGDALTFMHLLAFGARRELRQWLGAGHAMDRRLHESAWQQMRRLLLRGSVSKQVLPEGSTNVLVITERAS